jgi:hypothetical protein
MSAELTPWFGSEEKPSIVGVYETRIPNIGRAGTFQYWTGKRWALYAHNANDAALRGNAEFASSYQSLQWRGLAADPSAKVSP